MPAPQSVFPLVRLAAGPLKHASDVLMPALRGIATVSQPSASIAAKVDHHEKFAEMSNMFESPDMSKHVFKFGGQNVELHAGLQSDFVAMPKLMGQPVYTKDYVEAVKPVHKSPVKMHETVGLSAIRLTRTIFDKVTGWDGHKVTEAQCLQRIIFLETVAGVPGMVAGMLRHMRSLRTMKRDHGWIHTLLEEAENERMHLLTFMQIRQPGPIFKAMVLLAQGIFFNSFFVAYMISPRTCHSFVGYLEEEAVKTYTKIISEVEAGHIFSDTQVPQLGKDYWRMGDNATMRDLFLAIRADEQCHSHVNHTFANMETGTNNPFAAGQAAIQAMTAQGGKR